MTTQTIRSRAIATQDAAIASNVAKIEEARARPTALEALAERLNVSPGALTSTLKNTVFKGASNEEFVALVIVSNAYKLNPLLKEIYAFPAKGGGIVPVVSVDGWIRIINEHPQFDGMEFNDIVDEKGNLYAIESVIYRRDRSRPIKVTEYMDECKGNSPAWQKTPKRMLRHRAIIQGGRVAFGFSGIYVEDEAQTYVGSVQQDGGETARTVAPTRQQVAYDAETGEVEEDEETARRIDRDIEAAREGRTDEQHGDQHPDDDDIDPRPKFVIDLLNDFAIAATLADIKAADTRYVQHKAAMDDEYVADINAALAAARTRIGGAK